MSGHIDRLSSFQFRFDPRDKTTNPPQPVVTGSSRKTNEPNMTRGISSRTHIFPDELGDGAGQHEAGDGAAHDVEEGVHDPRAGGGFDRRTKGTAERAGSRSAAAAYLRRRRR